MYKKAEDTEIIWRWGHDCEDLQHLHDSAEKAYEVIGIHGVTAFAGKPPKDAVVSYAKVAELVFTGFQVFITPLDSNPEHRTVELPKPVIEQNVTLWNKVWNRG